MIFVSHSTSETEKLAEKVFASIAKKRVVSLEGELGGGKTTFVRGLAKLLSIKENIKSPTFFIMKKYKAQCPIKKFNFKNLYHFDCYRIKKSKEILELGWRDIVKDPKNLVLVEWGDKIKKILPPNTLKIKFEFLDEKKRKIIIH